MIELLILAGLAVSPVWNYIERKAHKKADALLVTNVPPKLSDEIELVVELLKTDDGWTYGPRRWEHESGVLIEQTLQRYDRFGNPYNHTTLKILNSDNRWESVNLLKADMSAIKSELKAFSDRAENRRRRALTVSLAQRITARERGEPLLGGPRADGSADTAEGRGDLSDAGSQSVSAGLLTYDPTTQRIVASVRGDNISLDMDAVLKDRYKLDRVRLETGHVIDRIMDSYDNY